MYVTQNQCGPRHEVEVTEIIDLYARKRPTVGDGDSCDEVTAARFERVAARLNPSNGTKERDMRVTSMAPSTNVPLLLPVACHQRHSSHTIASDSGNIGLEGTTRLD